MGDIDKMLVQKWDDGTTASTFVILYAMMMDGIYRYLDATIKMDEAAERMGL